MDTVTDTSTLLGSSKPSVVKQSPPSHPNSGNDYFEKELKVCRAQLTTTERHLAAANEARDRIGLKLEAAQNDIAELQRRTEFAAHQTKVLSDEIVGKEAALERANTEAAQRQTKLDNSRAECSKLKDALSKKEEEALSLGKTVIQLQGALVAAKEETQQRGRTIDGLTHEASILRGKLMTADEDLQASKRSCELYQAQVRRIEMAHDETKNQLRAAQKHVSKAKKLSQSNKEVNNKLGSLTEELRHLGIELLREQGALAELEARFVSQVQVNARKKAPNSDGEESTKTQLVELRSKVEILQRMLLLKEKQGAQQQAVLAEKDKEIEELRRALERRREADTSGRI